MSDKQEPAANAALRIAAKYRKGAPGIYLAKEIADAILAERERCAQVAYRVCAETRHVTLGDKASAAIRGA